MAQNPSLSLLDPKQAMIRTFDASNDAVRTVPAEATIFEVELDKADGDSVLAYKGAFLQDANYTSASTSPLTEQDVKGVSRLNLHLKVITQVNTDVTFTVEHSPVDSGDMWISSGLSLTAAAADAANTIKSDTLEEVLARRVRITASAAIASGDVRLALIGD